MEPSSSVCTGRSDYLNQVNNVFCFPYLFRILLDKRQTLKLDDKLKLVIAKSIASLAIENALMPSASDVCIRYLLPGLVAKELESRENFDYSREIAGKLLPGSASFNPEEILKCKYYLGFGSDRLCQAWGMSKVDSEVVLLTEYSGAGLWLLLINGTLVLMNTNLNKIEGLNVIGCIINSKTVYYNTSSREDYRSIFAIYCAKHLLSPQVLQMET